MPINTRLIVCVHSVGTANDTGGSTGAVCFAPTRALRPLLNMVWTSAVNGDMTVSRAAPQRRPGELAIEVLLFVIAERSPDGSRPGLVEP